MTEDFTTAMATLRATLAAERRQYGISMKHALERASEAEQRLAEHDRLHKMDTDYLRALLEVARAEAQASQRVSVLRAEKLDQLKAELAEMQKRIPVLRFRDDEAREDADRLSEALRGVRAYDGSGLHPDGFDGGRVECWVDHHGGQDCEDERCAAARDALAVHELSRDAPRLL